MRQRVEEKTGRAETNNVKELRLRVSRYVDKFFLNFNMCKKSRGEFLKTQSS